MVPAFRDDFVSHRSGNFRQPPPDFFQPGGRASILEFALNFFDVFNCQLRSIRSGFRDAYHDMFVLPKVQR
jgi:hypothetical protein